MCDLPGLPAFSWAYASWIWENHIITIKSQTNNVVGRKSTDNMVSWQTDLKLSEGISWQSCLRIVNFERVGLGYLVLFSSLLSGRTELIANLFLIPYLIPANEED